MAGPLAAVERFFERLFERPAARLFQAQVEPVQIQRSLERAMEAERTMHSRRPYAPSTTACWSMRQDHAALDPANGSLRTDLGESLRRYARAHGYTLLAQPRVEIEASTVVPAGRCARLRHTGRAPDRQRTEHSAAPDRAAPPRRPGRTPDDEPGRSRSARRRPCTRPVARTFRAPCWRFACPGQPVTRLPVRPGTIRLGRSLDNDVVLTDDRVSRHHGQIGIRHGMLVYTDLGSTNGSFLNGGAVTEIALGPGDVLQLGSSTITIEPSP